MSVEAVATASLLAIDVGNSRIKFGAFAVSGATAAERSLPEPHAVVAVPHGNPIPWETVGRWFSESGGAPSHAVVAGVQPAGIELVLNEWPGGRWSKPRLLRGAGELPLVVRVDAPDGVGIDRLLSAVAANVIRPGDRPAIVVDSGTATTVDLVAADGAFEGGAILPGVGLASRSLHQYTALLPLIAIEELSEPLVAPLGKNTRAAIRSGLLYGQIGAVKELVSQLSTGMNRPPIVIVTGGNGPLLTPRLGVDARAERDLPLRGLAVVAAATSGKQ